MSNNRKKKETPKGVSERKPKRGESMLATLDKPITRAARAVEVRAEVYRSRDTQPQPMRKRGWGGW